MDSTSQTPAEDIEANENREREWKKLMTEAKLNRCLEMNAVLQKSLWKLFSSAKLNFNIKMPFDGYYYADDSGYLCTSTGDDGHPKGHFKFEKDSDGNFFIYSNSKEKYLQIQTSSSQSAASVIFCADVDGKSKFELTFHLQQEKQHPGIVVDIKSLDNGCFLSLSADDVNEPNRLVVVATTPTAPLDKFLIIVEGME